MLADYAALEGAFVLGLGPLGLIAVSYLSAAPQGVEQFSRTVAPDVVMVSGRPGPLLRLQEAAAHARAAATLPLLGRPTCMALSAAMAH